VLISGACQAGKSTLVRIVVGDRLSPSAAISTGHKTASSTSGS
jgi:hypothetical protein